MHKLFSGSTRSCGCLRDDTARRIGKANLAAWSGSEAGKQRSVELGRSGKGRVVTHGMGRHELYGTWWMMITRCENPEYDRYYDYGGRGITVCERWHDVRLFIEDIEAKIGPRPPRKTLDRIDNMAGYQPDNVRWATSKEQRANSRHHRQTH